MQLRLFLTMRCPRPQAFEDAWPHLQKHLLHSRDILRLHQVLKQPEVFAMDMSGACLAAGSLRNIPRPLYTIFDRFTCVV